MVTVSKQALEKNGVGGLMLPSAEPRFRADQNGLEPSLIIIIIIIISDLSPTFFCYDRKCLFSELLSAGIFNTYACMIVVIWKCLC